MWSHWIYLVATVGVLCPYPGSFGCNPGELPPSVEEKIEFAMVVVQGTIVSNFSAPQSLIVGQYIAEVEVNCVLKDSGKRVPEKINITNAGPNPGKCFAAELVKGNTYVLFLRDLDTRYTVNAKEIVVQDAAVISKITSTCGLKVTDIYPEGKSESTTATKCPKITNRPCPTTMPPISTKRTKHPPKVTKPRPQTSFKTTSAATTSPAVQTTDVTGSTVIMETDTNKPQNGAPHLKMASFLVYVLVMSTRIVVFK